MQGEWFVRIIDVGYKLTREVYIFRRGQNGTEVLQGNGVVVRDEGAQMKPTIELFPEQLQALAEALAKNGFSPTKEYTTGKLEATETHLKDLRQMLKLK